MSSDSSNHFYQSPSDKKKELPTGKEVDAFDRPQAPKAPTAFPMPDSHYDPVMEELKLNRRKNIALVVLAMLTVVLFSLLIGQQLHSLKEQERTQKPIHRSILNMYDESTPLQVHKDFTYTYVVDGVVPLNLSPDEEANKPFNGKWVKQAGIYIARGDLAYHESKYDEAFDWYHKALNIYPELYDLHRFVGVIYLQRKDYTNAIDSLEKALVQSPEDVSLLNNIGVAYLSTTNIPQAAYYLDKAIKKTPTYPLSYFNMASLFYRQQQYHKALDYFKQFVNMQPNNTDARQKMAHCLVKTEQWEEAAKQLRWLCEKNPSIAPFFFRMAHVTLMLGKENEAINYLIEATEKVDYFQALRYLEREEFDLIRNHPAFEELVGTIKGTRT